MRWRTGHAGNAQIPLLRSALALAMGARAVAARRVGVSDVSTVVVTSTLAGLAAKNAWTGDLTGRAATHRRLPPYSRWAWGRRVPAAVAPRRAGHAVRRDRARRRVGQRVVVRAPAGRLLRRVDEKPISAHRPSASSCSTHRWS